MDLTQIKTNTGKTLQDFEIPQALIDKDPALVQLILQSESMKDSERQYWFNLTQVMKPEQVEKLRGILTKERDKLAEIDAKYKGQEVDPIEAARKARAMAEQRAAEQNRIKSAEAAHQDKEKAEEEAALAELEAL